MSNFSLKIQIFLINIFLSAILTASSLVKNGSFEEEQDNKENISGWKTAGSTEGAKVSRCSDTAKSGNFSVLIENNKVNLNKVVNVGISTNEFPSPPALSKINISAWLKAENVRQGQASYHKLRLTVYALDENKNKISHHEIVCTDGSFDWKIFSGTMCVPKGTDLLKVGCWLTNSTGKVWVDDVQVTVSELPPSASKMLRGNFEIDEPVIIPNPWKRIKGEGNIVFKDVAVSFSNLNKDISENVKDFFKSKNISCSMANEKKNESLNIYFIKGATSDTNHNKIKSIFPSLSLKDLGEEGYFLITDEKGDGDKNIYLTANTDRGLFYAFQTLKQIILFDDKNKTYHIPQLQIADKPTLSLRGMVMGIWLRQGKALELIKYCEKYKLNFLYIGGTCLDNKLGGNPKFGTNWRKPFSENEIMQLKSILEEAGKRFIDVPVTFSPRGCPATCYSSDEDIDIIVNKMNSLYKLGFRTLGINFDDLSNSGSEGMSNPKDIELFGNDIGKAHSYFTEEIYKRLAKITGKADFTFYFLPMAYGRFQYMNDKDKNYLEKVSDLNQKIKFIACVNGNDLISGKYNDFIKRKAVIWDNFFAGWERVGAPAFIPPFDGDNRLSDENISGYMILPLPPRSEDASQVSRITAADYLWSPERYNPEASFKRAVLQMLGNRDNIRKLADYIDRAERIALFDFPSGNTRKEKVNIIQAEKDFLNNPDLRQTLKSILPERLLKQELSRIDNNLKDLNMIIEDLQQREFPVYVKRKTGEITIDGKLDEPDWKECTVLDKFINIKTNAQATVQTSGKLMYDDDNVYIAVICHEPDVKNIKAKHTKPDAQVYEDDSLELFLDTRQDKKNYFHIVVNTIGNFYDAKTYHKNFR